MAQNQNGALLDSESKIPWSELEEVEGESFDEH